jgi:hypothetical protein
MNRKICSSAGKLFRWIVGSPPLKSQYLFHLLGIDLQEETLTFHDEGHAALRNFVNLLPSEAADF